MASNPNAELIQMTNSECGPFFDVAPILTYRPSSWVNECLEFTERVREWLKANDTVRYAVLSSPFGQYLSGEIILLSRTGERAAGSVELATKEFEKTLSELEEMGITPIVVSPPPANGSDLGRCLSRADWSGQNLDRCNFRVAEISQNITSTYKFLENIARNYQVIRLDSLTCDTSVCLSHLDSTYVYRDSGHLSLEGSIALGKIYDFYGMIVGDAAIDRKQ